MLSFEFNILGGFWLVCSFHFRRLNIELRKQTNQKQAIRGYAIAPAASLASLSPVAASGTPTILATVINREPGMEPNIINISQKRVNYDKQRI